MENRKLFILEQTTIKKLLTTYKLKIPDFQRSFVWKKSKKQQLLESLFKGFPIGALTLYVESGQYYIIDGLQRINTLQQYLSSPAEIVGFKEYYEEVRTDLAQYIKEHDLVINETQLKKSIKKWYEGLQELYAFEKVTLFYNAIKDNKSLVSITQDFQILEELSDILKKRIQISYDDIALIIYQGEKEDLPELFKNINTGSVALSQYEILQSLWVDRMLDCGILNKEYIGFVNELAIIQGEYEVNSIKEKGNFDIFKNMIGLNNLICSKKDAETLFGHFKKLNPLHENEDGTIKYYENDSIAFEIYSSIICCAPNKIVKAMDIIFNKHGTIEVSQFVSEFNEIILDAIDDIIIEIEQVNWGYKINKYQAIYLIAGVIFSKYLFDFEKLTIECNSNVYDLRKTVFNFTKQKDEKWFVDENRQVGFLNQKIEQLKNNNYM